MANYGSSRQRTVAGSETVDLNRVGVFLRVVEDGSFTRAARRMGLPKSSVSRSITALEKALGVRLLRRTTRALSLTDAGRTYFQQVRPALESLNQSAASLRALGTEARGRVRLSCALGSEELISEYVARFKKKNPLVQLDVSFSQRHVDLVAEGFDLAVRAGVLKDSSLIARKVETTDLGLYAAAGYLRRAGTPKTLAELAGHACIGMESQTGRGVWTLTDVEGKEESVEVSFGVTSDLMQFGVRTAVMGLGVALIPQVIATALVEAGGLVRVLPKLSHLGTALSVVYPSRTFEPLAVTLFKEGLIEALTNLGQKRCKVAARRLLE